ncbi:MAG: radical SAM protein [Pseudomonadota bacterium]
MSSDKVLLIKPDYCYFPIGFAYIVTALERAEIPYKFIDCYLDPNPDLNTILTEENYIAVATGGLIGNYTFFRNLFATIKKIAPSIPRILGGNITIDLNTARLLAKIPADFLVIGEGDITFPLLLERLVSGRNEFSDIKGLAFRAPKTHKGFIKTPKRPPLDLKNDNRILNWDFFDRQKYGFATMPVLTGRGCTGRCSFCSPTNGKFRGRPLKHILEEIENLNSKHDFVHFVFMNEIFFPDEENIYNFCREYKQIKPFKKWHCLMRMDINPNVLKAMHDAGCTVMNVGVESGSNRVLSIIKKDLSTTDTRSFIHAAKNEDIICQASIMMANYDETEDDIKKTVDLMLELQISGPMALTINYPGTLNYVRALKRDLIPDEDRYLESLDRLYSKNYYQVISGHLSGELNYLNLSAMPDHQLFSVVEREMRRYYTTGFCIQNTQQKRTKHHDLIELVGNCPFCNQQLAYKVDTNELAPLDLRPTCTKCGEKDMIFNALQIDEYAKYFANIKNKISAAKRPIIVSGVYDTRFLLMFDFFGIQFDKLLGFIAHREMPTGYALTHRLIPYDKALDLNPDLFIITDSIPIDILSQIGTQHLKAFLEKSVMLSMGGPIPNKTILTNQLSAGSKILLISSGPIQLLELLLPTIERPDLDIRYDILIQQSREHVLDHFSPNKTYLFTDGQISREHIGIERIKTLTDNQYDIIIFLANNDSLKNYQKVQEVIQDMQPQYTLAFPIGNTRVYDTKDMYLIDLSSKKKN